MEDDNKLVTVLGLAILAVLVIIGCVFANALYGDAPVQVETTSAQ